MKKREMLVREFAKKQGIEYLYEEDGVCYFRDADTTVGCLYDVVEYDVRNGVKPGMCMDWLEMCSVLDDNDTKNYEEYVKSMKNRRI